MSAFIDDEEFTFAEWAEEFEVLPEELCPWCAGEGSCGGEPCPCLVAEAFRLYPAAAEEATPVPGCGNCEGDGETIHGTLCPCMLPSFRAAHEQIVWS